MDGPWTYNDKRRGRGGAAGHYECLRFGEIAAHIERYAHPKQCTVAAWETWPLEEAIDAFLRGLGFRKVGLLFLWIKTTDDGAVLPHPPPGRIHVREYTEAFGGGLAGTRGNTEPCFLWRRGHPLRRHSASEREPIFAPVREHSRKPIEARERLERLWPIEDRIELYATGRVRGWRTFGKNHRKGK